MASGKTPRATHCMIFHRTHPRSRPPDRSSRLEVYIVRSGRRTGPLDRAGLSKKKEATYFNHTCISQCRRCTTTLMFTRSPKCQRETRAEPLSLIRTAEDGRSDRHVEWWAVSYVPVVMHMTARNWCLADVGYACQSTNEGTFIILWLMLIDWSSKDKKAPEKREWRAGKQCNTL